LHAPKTSLILAADADVDSAPALAMANAVRSRLVCSFVREGRLNIVISSGSGAGLNSGIGRSTVGVVPSRKGSSPVVHSYLVALVSCLSTREPGLQIEATIVLTQGELQLH
jgi:hypothetical protein